MTPNRCIESQKSISLRQSSAQDADFAFAVLKESMRAYVIATWGTWLEDETRRQAVEDASSGRTEVIELEGVPVGIQLVERTKTHIQLRQLYILGKFQRRGLGTELIERLQREARKAHLPIRLRVLKVNPARGFYERLGFVVIETMPERWVMEWVP